MYGGSEMAELMIFKAGKYPQGDWPKERVQKMVDSYDPEKSWDAPVVIGHRGYGVDDNYQDAHGWVKSLRMDGGGKVFADIPEFSADVKKKIAEKKLRYMSVEIYEFDKVDEAQPPYLRAIALLGRDTPAVAGTKLALFSLMQGGVVNTVNEEEKTCAFTHKVSADEMKTFAGNPAGEKPTQEVNMDELEKLKAQNEKLCAEFAAEKEKLSLLEKENAVLRNAEKKGEAEAFFAKLRDEGKLTPAVFDKAAALDARLSEEERKDFRALFGCLGTQVDLSGKHAVTKKDAPEPSAMNAGVTAQIRAFQKEHKLATFADAAEALFAAKPELFADEGGAA
jgi:hypothetical protein